MIYEGDSPRRYSTQVLFVLFLLAPTTWAQEVLTNQAVIDMTKAHVKDATIIDMIQKNPGKYVVTSSALIALKQAGVSDEAISAMRAKMAARSEAPPSASKAVPRRNQPSPTRDQACRGVWRVADKVDPITGVSTFEGRMCADATSNERPGTFSVFATCDAKLAFRVVYLADPNPGYQFSGGNILYHEAHVVMRMSIDGNVNVVASSTTDHPNEATIIFLPTASAEDKKAEGAFGAVIRGAVSAARLSAGSPSEAFGANLIKVELPLADGGRPILEIRPQEPGFKKFASRCSAAENARAREAAERERLAIEEQERRDKEPKFVCPGDVLQGASIDPKSGAVHLWPERLNVARPGQISEMDKERDIFKIPGNVDFFHFVQGEPHKSCGVDVAPVPSQPSSPPAAPNAASSPSGLDSGRGGSSNRPDSTTVIDTPPVQARICGSDFRGETTIFVFPPSESEKQFGTADTHRWSIERRRSVAIVYPPQKLTVLEKQENDSKVQTQINGKIVAGWVKSNRICAAR